MLYGLVLEVVRGFRLGVGGLEGGEGGVGGAYMHPRPFTSHVLVLKSVHGVRLIFLIITWFYDVTKVQEVRIFHDYYY